MTAIDFKTPKKHCARTVLISSKYVPAIAALTGLSFQIRRRSLSAASIPVRTGSRYSASVYSSRPIVAYFRSIRLAEGHKPSQPRLNAADLTYFCAPGYGGEVITRSTLLLGNLSELG